MIEEFCDWLSTTPLSVALQSANWFVPLVQTVHIIAIAILLVTIYVIALHMLGVVRGAQALAVIMRKSAPWIWTMLCILLISGALLTITEPSRELLNWVFRIKMLLVLGMAAIIALVQGVLRTDPDFWNHSSGRRLAGRVVGFLVLILGAGIVTAGRWIAYV